MDKYCLKGSEQPLHPAPISTPTLSYDLVSTGSMAGLAGPLQPATAIPILTSWMASLCRLLHILKTTPYFTTETKEWKFTSQKPFTSLKNHQINLWKTYRTWLYLNAVLFSKPSGRIRQDPYFIISFEHHGCWLNYLNNYCSPSLWLWQPRLIYEPVTETLKCSVWKSQVQFLTSCWWMDTDMNG